MATYRDQVRPSLIDTAIPDTGRASGAQQLAQTLKQFEHAGAQILGTYAAEQGRREGAEAGRTDHPNLRSGIASTTAYGRAYNNAATRAYAIKSEAAADEAATRLESEAGNDPEHFRVAFGARRDEILKNAPAEAKALLAEVYDRRMAAGVSKLQQAQLAEAREENRNILAEGVQRSTDRLAQLRASRDPALQAQAEEEQVKLDLLINGALQDGTLSATEAGALRVDAARQATKQVVSYRFREELENPYGDPVAFIQNVRDRNKTSEALSPAEEEKLVESLITDLRQHNALRSMAQQASDDTQAVRWALGDREATNAMLERRLTVDKLSQMVEDDQLDPAVARTLKNDLESGNDRPDDAQERFRVETTLLEQTEDEISKNSQLSYDTRRELVLKRREQLAGWRGTQAAREASERIDRSLGLLPNMPARAMSPEELRKRDRALTEWYNAVEALPPDKRQQELIPQAEIIINKVIRTDAQARAARLRDKAAQGRAALASGELDDQEQEDLKDEIARYERSIAELEAKGK
jgi:hypothetical protein